MQAPDCRILLEIFKDEEVGSSKKSTVLLPFTFFSSIFDRSSAVTKTRLRSWQRQ